MVWGPVTIVFLATSDPPPPPCDRGGSQPQPLAAAAHADGGGWLSRRTCFLALSTARSQRSSTRRGADGGTSRPPRAVDAARRPRGPPQAHQLHLSSGAVGRLRCCRLDWSPTPHSYVSRRVGARSTSLSQRASPSARRPCRLLLSRRADLLMKSASIRFGERPRGGPPLVSCRTALFASPAAPSGGYGADSLGADGGQPRETGRAVDARAPAEAARARSLLENHVYIYCTRGPWAWLAGSI